MRKKSKLTPQEQNDVLAVLSLGGSRTAAARRVCRSPHILQREIIEHPRFAEQVAKAEEGIEVLCLSHIRKAVQKEQYWRAAAWILERRLPDRYGTKKANTLTAEQMQKFMATCMQIIAEELPDEKRREQIFSRLAEELEE